MEEIFWEKLPCVVVKLWFKFREISSSFDRVSDFSSLSFGLFSGLFLAISDHPEIGAGSSGTTLFDTG